MQFENVGETICNIARIFNIKNKTNIFQIIFKNSGLIMAIKSLFGMF